LIKGFSSGTLMGTSFMAWTEDPKTERRSSSESSFLASSKAIKLQLAVYNNTFAEKLIFRGPDNRAGGVIVTPEPARGRGSESGSYTLLANKGTESLLSPQSHSSISHPSPARFVIFTKEISCDFAICPPAAHGFYPSNISESIKNQG